jgi:hypothetical protein
MFGEGFRGLESGDARHLVDGVADVLHADLVASGTTAPPPRINPPSFDNLPTISCEAVHFSCKTPNALGRHFICDNVLFFSFRFLSSFNPV